MISSIEMRLLFLLVSNVLEVQFIYIIAINENWQFSVFSVFLAIDNKTVKNQNENSSNQFWFFRFQNSKLEIVFKSNFIKYSNQTSFFVFMFLKTKNYFKNRYQTGPYSLVLRN